MTSAYLDRPRRSLIQAVGDRCRRGTLDLTTARALVADRAPVADRDLVDMLNAAAPHQSSMAIDDLGGALARC